jgi:phosphoenolpyruvate synthase/pyruvate phosphate dikinase
VVEEEIMPDKSSVFCLSDEEAREIGKLGRIIEEHFGVPQDLEWAVDSGLPSPQNIILLQTRPVITGPQKSATEKILDLFADFVTSESSKRTFLDRASNL